MKKLLITLLFSLFLACSANAQVAKQDAIWVWDDFSGGLNSQISNTSTPKNQATVAENVRFSTELKSLSKRDPVSVYGNASTTEPILGMHRLYLKDGTKTLLVNHANHISKGNDDNGTFTILLNLTNSSRRMLWTTWQNMAVGTDGYNRPVKCDGFSNACTYLGSVLATPLATGDGPSGTYTYKFSFYTNTSEVSLNTTSNSFNITDNDVNITMIPIPPETFLGETVVGKKVYRNVDNGTAWKLLSNGNLTNLSVVQLVDSDADGALGDELNATYNMTPPYGRIVTIHKNRLWLANNPTASSIDESPSSIYYSEDGCPDVFLADSILNVRPNDGDTITFATNFLGILTVGKDNTIQKIYTEADDPLNWSISDPFSRTGCRSIYSAKVTPLGIVYLANDGIYRFNGQYSSLISEAVTPVIKDISESNIPNTWGEWHKNIYYLAYPSKASGVSTNNRVLLFDTLANAYAIDLIDINAFTTFSSGTDWDVLYSGSSTNGTVYAHSDSVHELVHKKVSDFSGTHNDTMVTGDENEPVLSLGWNCTIDGWLTDLQGRDANISVIDNITTFLPDATIDMPDKNGSYISPFMNVKISKFDKLYWNEFIPATGADVTLAIRANTTNDTCNNTSWSSEYTDPTGSDISAVSGGDVMQYRVTFNTSNTTATPYIYKANNYAIKITSSSEGQSRESVIPLHWVTGWTDLDYPSFDKTLKKISLFYDSNSTGYLNVTIKNYEGDSDTFNIDLSQNATQYSEYFTNGALRGEKFLIDFYSNDVSKLRIKKVIIRGDVEPLI